jgi:hypothetical protein
MWPKKNNHMNKFELYLKTDKNNCINFLYKTMESDYNKASYLQKLRSLSMADSLEKVKEWSKLISIVIKVKDLALCRRLLSITKELSHKQKVELVREFGWPELKDSLNLLPITLGNVCSNCGLVNVSS